MLVDDELGGIKISFLVEVREDLDGFRLQGFELDEGVLSRVVLVVDLFSALDVGLKPLVLALVELLVLVLEGVEVVDVQALVLETVDDALHGGCGFELHHAVVELLLWLALPPDLA